MPILKSIDILSTAKIYGLFGVVIGLVLGIFYGLVATGRFVLGFGGIALVIVMPILCGVMMFFYSAICAFLYNVFAKWVGGVKLEFQQ
jgi:hypothetical protein